VEQADPQVW